MIMIACYIMHIVCADVKFLISNLILVAML